MIQKLRLLLTTYTVSLLMIIRLAVPAQAGGDIMTTVQPDYPIKSHFSVKHFCNVQVEKLELREKNLGLGINQLIGDLPGNRIMQTEGNYYVGIYIIEIIQGKQKKVLEVTKQVD